MLRKFPLAVTSLIIGMLSFFHLFGLEKAVLAIALGGIALKEIRPGEEQGRKYAYAGVILGSLYVLIIVVFIVLKGPAILGMISKLR